MILQSRAMAGVTTVERGSRNSPDSRMFFKDAAGNLVSPFHDIPMLASEYTNTLL